ncbi:triacylglycerol lipase OBL1 [Diospyros lotus]|uniref:triacylglycerol lipase OBL1 n=1 Tax=Diospyros lotus TaxID=55363 RepID=UPI00225694CB|nr:triacylglycerol lipase OBL1 [Diospyros lotus]XP_052181775.1 triacylglycerol lipase OBL1 [Diospyros lotus]
MAVEIEDSDPRDLPSPGSLRYLIVRPENGGIRDLFKLLVSPDYGGSAAKFLESSDEDAVADESSGGGAVAADHRWVIFVSILVRKIIAVFGKPMEWTGYFFEFLLNLLAGNAGLSGLLWNLLRGKVVMPQRGSETFISAIGHLDRRIDLYKSNSLAEGTGDPAFGERVLQVDIGNGSLLDLCMMASKLAYENAKVIKNVVNHHWKMHFVDFYNCWNDYQKERSTQVFILCDKRKDANLILISFRGTEPFDADDWSTDFDYSWYEIPELGKVHMGFLEALGLGNRADTSTFNKLLQPEDTRFSSSNGLDLRAHPSEYSEGLVLNGEKPLIPQMAEMSAYFAVKSKLKVLLNEHKTAKFIVTGHSLGGALAVLFPTVLVLHEERELMQRLLGVYTYGQPRVGNRQLGRSMEAHLGNPIPRYFRVVYCNDLVPRLPYDDKTFRYKHFGKCLYYNSLYVEQQVDEEPNRNYFGIRYMIPEHLIAVWELIRSVIIGYTHGPEYKEGWISILLRIAGLVMPGISAHSPTNYVNSIRLGRDGIIDMSSQ